MGLQEMMRAETDVKIKSIVERAERSAEEATLEAQRERDEALAEERKKLDEIFSEKLESAKGRVELEERIEIERAKEKLFTKVRDEIIREAEGRTNKNYLLFITSSIIRGAEAIGSNDVIADISKTDENLFKKDSKMIIEKLKERNINLVETRFALPQKGAVIYDREMRRSFTDTIEARVKRIEESIREELLSGIEDES